jgi:alkylation response protein AidB-like acyl-CoA dehydrogenase
VRKSPEEEAQRRFRALAGGEIVAWFAASECRAGADARGAADISHARRAKEGYSTQGEVSRRAPPRESCAQIERRGEMTT